MATIFEHDPSRPIGPNDRDGMEDMMAELDAPSSTDWDISCEEPPHAWYKGPKIHANGAPGKKAIVFVKAS